MRKIKKPGQAETIVMPRHSRMMRRVTAVRSCLLVFGHNLFLGLRLHLLVVAELFAVQAAAAGERTERSAEVIKLRCWYL